MSYYAADANGYLEDVASIGGMRDMRAWSKTQSATIRQFFELGLSKAPQDLAKELLAAHAEGVVQGTIRNLARVAEQADEILILSDGNNG